jgi:hypothetical protein
LTEAEFWELSLAGFGRLLDRKAEAEKWLDLRAGVIAAILANQNRGRSSRAYTPADFFVSLQDPGEIRTLADVPKGWKVTHGAQAREWMDRLALEKVNR